MKDRNSVASPRRGRRGWSVGLFVLALSLVPASSSLAAEVGGPSSFFTNGIVVEALPGETNTLVIQGTRSIITVTDTAGAPVTDDGSGGGVDDPECVQDNPSQVTCNVANVPPAFQVAEFTGAFVTLLDGNDSVTLGGSLDLFPIDASGGDGNDTLSAGVGFASDFDGDAGDDTLTGGRFGDEMRGGFGNDTVNGGLNDDFVAGGDGNDLVNGENGNDTVSGGIGDDNVTGGTGGDTSTATTATTSSPATTVRTASSAAVARTTSRATAATTTSTPRRTRSATSTAVGPATTPSTTAATPAL